MIGISAPALITTALAGKAKAAEFPVTPAPSYAASVDVVTAAYFKESPWQQIQRGLTSYSPQLVLNVVSRETDLDAAKRDASSAWLASLCSPFATDFLKADTRQLKPIVVMDAANASANNYIAMLVASGDSNPKVNYVEGAPLVQQSLVTKQYAAYSDVTNILGDASYQSWDANKVASVNDKIGPECNTNMLKSDVLNNPAPPKAQ